MRKLIILSLIMVLIVACTSPVKKDVIVLQNPIIPGYFADPSVVEFEGKYYMYATVDPWGADFLSCWVTEDFVHWTFNKLNWPTKEACTSPLSSSSMVWAPSVIQRGDYYYMYISVGSEIWAGKAKHPLGPWENMLGDKPLVPFDTTMYSHEIDAEAFIDDDGRVYLYWGSGWNWTNGRCWVVELDDDMVTFKTEKKEITPENFFEGAWMIRNNDKYFLTYSEGKTIEDSYEVRYAVGDSPFGPFTQAANSPILTKDESLQVYGPGHHTIINLQGQHYIMYHRHRLPFVPGNAYRQICMNPLNFTKGADMIDNIVPEHTVAIPRLTNNVYEYILPLSVEATSGKDEFSLPVNIADQHFGTLWEASATDKEPVITVSFERNTQLANAEIRFEYPWKKYYFVAEASLDGLDWIVVADYAANGIEGSPVDIQIGSKLRHFRLRFVAAEEAASPAIWEIFFTK